MMKVRVLVPFRVRTKEGELELKEGDLVRLDDVSARRLIDEGKVGWDKMAPRKIYSKLLGEEIWMVADRMDLESLALQGVAEAVYIAWETYLLKEMSERERQAVHQIKKAFLGSVIELHLKSAGLWSSENKFEMWLEENGKVRVLSR